MSLGEAIISSIIILVTTIIVASAAQTTTVTNDVTPEEVPIVWQQRLVHNAINNPYIELSEDENLETDPDRELVESAGFVPYTSTSAQEESPEEEYIPAATTVSTTLAEEPIEDAPIEDAPIEDAPIED